jgi:hypothetical protein
MFLRRTRRWKDGKEHYYWSLVENRRCRGNRVVQHTVLYLGEINDSQKEQWIRAIEVFDEDRKAVDQLKLFAAERPPAETAADRVSVRLREFEMHRARQWGGCWHKLRLKAPGLSVRSLLEQLSAIPILDVHFPTTDGRTLIFCRYTMPNKTQKLLLAQLGLELPPQSPPRITSNRSLEALPA